MGSAPKGEWIFGEIGGVVINDAAANRTALDAIAPDHPVVLETYFGHGLLINSAAMERLGVRDGQKDPFGGRMERDPASKKLNGKLFEYAHWRTTAKLAAMVPEADLLSEIKRRAVVAASYGVTTLQIMSLLPTRRFVELLEKADLPVRVRVINFGLTGAGSRDLTGIAEMARMRPKNSRVTVSGIKWILDGTPIERGAALRREYFDRQGWTGAMNFPQSDIEAMVRESLRYNQPLLLHCIGDRACSAAMDAMESVGEKMINWRAKRVRLEHGENVTGELIERAKRLGVIIVQNPTHFTDGEMGRARWGGGKSPIRSYVDAGIPFALGSDGPVNPFLNIMFATIHPDNPGQAISREQAVRAYTSGSAYAEFAETSKGTIEPGKLADIAVLSHDIFSVPTDSMPGTKSVMTIVGGKIVHDGLNSK